MHQGHRNRLKNRFINEGLENFDHHNILELLLYYAVPQKDTNETAHKLIEHFGSISEVFDAPVSELMRVSGIGHHSAVLLSMIPQISRIYLTDKSSKSRIIGTKQIADFAAKCFVGMTTEHFLIICVDNRGAMLNYHYISEGVVDGAMVNMRKIILTLASSNATAAIIAHNHPRNNSKPSRADLKTTMNIATALKFVNVKLLDHVIVGLDGYTSLAENPKMYGCYLNPVL